jgi:alanyl-tRNA synthetase
LSNTSQLQSVKITRVAKEKGAWRVFFLAGDRVLKALHAALEVQRGLTSTLCVAPEQMVDAVKRLQAEAKTSNKQLAGVLKELAEIDANRIVTSLQGGAKVAQLHRDEVGLTYLSNVSDLVTDLLKANAAPAPFVLLLSSADSIGGKEGAFILVGDESKVTALGPELTAKLQGKAGGRKGKMQGKGTGLDAKNRAEAVAWLQEKMQQA